MNTDRCVLFPNIYGLLIQLILLFICGIGLILKRSIEFPKRPFIIFILDTSKQLFGAAWLHFFNLLFSVIFSAEKYDACEWYWINIMIDTTLGVLISYILLRFSEKILNYNSGYYIIEKRKYIFQLFIWLCIVSIMKCIVLLIMIFFKNSLMYISHFLLKNYNSSIKLFIVMIITPFLMNLLQSIIQDTYIKSKNILIYTQEDEDEDLIDD
eukprot:GHVL01007646.1.p1 GENE.GHVL01007646.1~~GHVL01007646.1.p1  ORF type:complete len:227 (-),score=53.29 GHVL01007646.1:398-1030(-)